jgi:hypothetical protein
MSRTNEQTEDVQITDAEEVKPQKRKRSSKNAQTSNEQSKNGFSVNVLINFLNNYYSRCKWPTLDGSSNKQTISFRNTLKKKAPTTPIIELSKYSYLMAFFQQYKDQFKESENINTVINSVWDFRLRGALTLAEQFSLNKSEDVGLLLEQMDLSPPHTYEIRDLIEYINEFLRNENQLKLKIFNSVFPHPKHKEDGGDKGVNLVYLQRYSSFVENVLEQIKSGADFDDILEKCQQDLRTKREEHYKAEIENNSVTKEAAQRIFYQITNPNIINLVDACDNKKNIIKYIKTKIPVFKRTKKNGKFVYEPVANQQLTSVECNEIIQYVRESKSVLSFINMMKRIYDIILSRGETFEHYLDEFNRKISLIHEFVQEHSNIPEEVTFTTFITMVAEVCKLLKETGIYNNPVTQFAADIRNIVPLKFPNKLRVNLVKYINNEHTNSSFVESVLEYENDWQQIVYPKAYSIDSMEIYSKIGKFGNIGLEKRYRLAVGLALISWIQEEIRQIRALNVKRRDIKILLTE